MAIVQAVENLLEVVMRMRPLSANVKLDIRTSCKLGMLLAIAVDQALACTETDNLMKLISEEDQAGLREVAATILKMAGAEEVYELLKRIVKR